MDWSKSNSDTLWDPIRSRWIKTTAEEKIRQKLLHKMIGELGFPKGLLNVEKEMCGGRRFDIICYAPRGEEIVPLLLVECKAALCSEAAVRQLEGYNSSLGAPFLCLASGAAIETFWWVQGKRASVPFLPKYTELLSKL